MTESDIHGEGGVSAPAAGPRTRRATTTRKTAAPRPASAARKPAAARKRKPALGARPAGSNGRDFEGLLQNLAKKASGARDRLASASGDGVEATKRVWQKMSGASRKAIGRLSAEWKQMEPTTKAQVLAALLTTLAAASAPLVRKRLKRR